jgi:hypothetical protein
LRQRGSRTALERRKVGIRSKAMAMCHKRLSDLCRGLQAMHRLMIFRFKP